jgi:putative transcriptional regulator
VIGSALKRFCLASAAMALAAALLIAAAPPPLPLGSGAGALLIAAPSIGDPRFYHTVILMVRHDDKGALGIVINRPIGMRSLASLITATGGKADGVAGKARVFAGGPVEPQLGFVIHSTDYQRAGTLKIDGRVAVTTNPGILLDIGHKKGPRKSLIAFGYAGWAAGQLEGEIDRHAWFMTPEEPELVFDHPRSSLWRAAMARRTLSL